MYLLLFWKNRNFEMWYNLGGRGFENLYRFIIIVIVIIGAYYIFVIFFCIICLPWKDHIPSKFNINSREVTILITSSEN